MKLIDRMNRLEARRAIPAADAAQIERDAEAVHDKLSSIAADYRETDASKSLAERLAMSPAQHVAWAIRFDPANADVAAIIDMHAQRRPALL